MTKWPEEVVERIKAEIEDVLFGMLDAEEIDRLSCMILDALGGERVSALYREETGEFLVAAPLHEENQFMVPALLVPLGGE